MTHHNEYDAPCGQCMSPETYKKHTPHSEVEGLVALREAILREAIIAQAATVERHYFAAIGAIDNLLATALTTHSAKEREVDENTSDGYHTFKELYEFRLLYNAHLFNEWAAQGKYDVHKSQRHNDGELCFGRDDYFVVVATLPTGQISNHYPMTDWDLFKCEAVEKAKAQWDGHTSQDVANRLRAALPQTDVTKN